MFKFWTFCEVVFIGVNVFEHNKSDKKASLMIAIGLPHFLGKCFIVSLNTGKTNAGVHNSVLSSCLGRCRAGVKHSSSAVSSVC